MTSTSDQWVSAERQPQPTIVDWLEANEGVKPLPACVSEPSKVWVDRVFHAMIDPDVSVDAYDELGVLFDDYLDTVGSAEAHVASRLMNELADWCSRPGWPKCRSCGTPICPHCHDMAQGHRR